MANLAFAAYNADKRFAGPLMTGIGVTTDGGGISTQVLGPGQVALTSDTLRNPIGQAAIANGVEVFRSGGTYDGRRAATAQAGASAIAVGAVITAPYVNAGTVPLNPNQYITGIDMTTAANPAPT